MKYWKYKVKYYNLENIDWNKALKANLNKLI